MNNDMQREFSQPPSPNRFRRAHRTLATLLAMAALIFTQTDCGKRPPPPPPPVTTAPSSTPSDLPTTSDITSASPELEIRIEPARIEKGASAILTWEARNAHRVEIEPAIGPVDLSGRIKFFPDETTTYTVRAEGPGGQATDSVTVEVWAQGTGGGSVREEDLAGLSLEERFSVFVKPVFFAFDSAELSEEARITLDGNVEWLNQLENRHLNFVVEGHSDERGSEEYNLALGDKRAAIIVQYLVDHGIDSTRVTAVALGEERPFEKAQTEEAYALNRRGHFIVLTDNR